MARDVNAEWVKVEFNCFWRSNVFEVAIAPRDPAKAKKRVLAELQKYGLRFNETPSFQIDPDSAGHALLALRLQAATPGMTYAEASSKVRTERAMA